MLGTSTTAGPATGANAASLRLFIFALFFVFGSITSLNDVLIPKLKHLFDLSYAQAMLIQSAFFVAYLLVSLPAAAVVNRLGYLRSATVGLLVMTVGCLMFVPASTSGLFAPFLAALFVLAAGVTVVQVVANPLISMLGRPETAHSRLTFAQAFNSLGTTIAPYVGAIVILGAIEAKEVTGRTTIRAAETTVIVQTYLGIAAVLAAVALIVWLRRRDLIETKAESTSVLPKADLLRLPRFRFGTLGIFVYVGGEVAIGSLLVNYLSQASVLGLGAEQAGKLVSLYWGGAMVGRFVGAGLLRMFPPATVLIAAAAVAAALLCASGFTVGAVSGWSLLAIGLFNSIMFTTIFSLACEGLGARAAEGSGIICVAIVGGAIIPPLTGLVADAAGLHVSLIVPFLCYCVIAAFGLFCRREPASAAA